MRFQLAIGALLVVALGAVGRAEDISISLAVRDSGFQPAELTAPPGAKVRLEVSNETAGVIEFESFDLNRERVVQPGQKVNVYLSGLGEGKYEFFDDFNQQRRGVLHVK